MLWKKITDAVSSGKPAPFMPQYLTLQVGLVIILFAGWLVYHLWYKNRHYKELKNDAVAIAFFAGVWGFIVYLFY